MAPRDQHPEPTPRNVEGRARELLEGGREASADVVDDRAEAERAARRILEESEARTGDPATTDPTDDGVIRRASEETA